MSGLISRLTRAAKNDRTTTLFFIIISVVALGLGMSDSIFANYFKDAYAVDAAQRGFIELPRELPGVFCMFIVAALSMLGDVRLALIAQVLSCVGLMALGLFTPPFGVMLVFLFINSMGMHLYMPLADGIGLSIIKDPKAVGKRIGQYSGVRTAFGMIASIIVYLGYRTFNWFSFTTPIKWVFLIAAMCFVASFLLILALQNSMGPHKIERRGFKLLFRKEYTNYYILAVMNGAQKQIMYVYGPWVLIELLKQNAGTLALLGMLGAGIGIFFMPMVGKWTDRFGVRRMLFAEALSFISIYALYGVVSGGIYTGSIGIGLITVGIVFTIFMLDKMSAQMHMVRIVYLNQITVDRSEITRTLSTGVFMDHVVSISCALLGGTAWMTFGPQYVFYGAAALSLVNLAVAFRVKPAKAAA